MLMHTQLQCAQTGLIDLVVQRIAAGKLSPQLQGISCRQKACIMQGKMRGTDKKLHITAAHALDIMGEALAASAGARVFAGKISASDMRSNAKILQMLSLADPDLGSGRCFQCKIEITAFLPAEVENQVDPVVLRPAGIGGERNSARSCNV